MLDQSFSVSNFRKIFDYENRKGCYLEGRYYPGLEKISKELKTCATEFKSLNKEKSTLSIENYENKKTELNDKKNRLKEQKEILLNAELEKICKQINEGDYCVELIKVNTPKGNKVAYSIEKNNICAYFIIKQIQYTLKKLYKVQQSNRYNIICSLRGILDNNFPKYIIRTDIEAFYESISQDHILNKINKDSLLTLSSKKIIQNIFVEYKKLSGSSSGIPRGIGISAYLAELYLREFDEAIKRHSDIIFYARYVDDIIAIYAPKPDTDISDLFNKIKDEAAKLSLTLKDKSSGKTDEIDLRTPSNKKFEYLGYKFNIESKKVNIGISDNKTGRYKKRLEIIFSEYEKQKPTEIIARKLLINRIRFITGNTRLSNNKDNALVGIYFTNNLITDSSCLNKLDTLLTQKINNSQALSDRVKKRLLKITFKTGWEQKIFYKFSVKEIQEIVKVWKDVA